MTCINIKLWEILGCFLITYLTPLVILTVNCLEITSGGEKSYKETRACALVSLSDYLHPSVYKSHILNRVINKLYLSSEQIHKGHPLLIRIVMFTAYKHLKTFI